MSTLKGEIMGCDIHWHSETKRNGQWECDQADSFSINTEEHPPYKELNNFPNWGRDYWFFGLIQSGVCTEWPWSFPERITIPEDLSQEVKQILDQWDSDGHSHGYLTRAELKAKREELRTLQANALINPTDLMGVIHHHAKRLDEVIGNLKADVPDTDQRIVFFFDN